MRILKAVGSAAVWAVAAVGVLSVLVWAASALGLVKPLVVISGSMEPRIMTGDLLLAVPTPTDELQVGDVATIRDEHTGRLVSHRVVSVEPSGDGRWDVRMKGDANVSPDGGTYVVGDRVWQPVAQVSGGGDVLARVTQPSVAIPFGVALAALLGLSLLPPTTPQAASAVVVPEGQGSVPEEVRS
ncbi:signal peptidase I [Cellulomonas sp. JZ18]|uniref:signal peptidase I n=1 Tax=Cellulomonas sp. JZ18 TaxID=2654191 RepID=UPI0012D41382|nr:signal peptidase I [Cellulomonas sp. JZ18]QGQ19690.1 signal peptidase I [Cellulomonas sp. JZ18]